MTHEEKILKLQAMHEKIAKEMVGLKAATSDPEWNTVSEHGQPPRHSVVELWFPGHTSPISPPRYMNSNPCFEDGNTRYRIIRTPEESKRFLKHGAPLPIDSDEHEWHPNTELPNLGMHIVARSYSGAVIKDKYQRGNLFMRDYWATWAIKDWRYCTPGEVPNA